MKLSGIQLADRGVAKIWLDSFNSALHNISINRWVSVTVGTKADNVTIDFSQEPEVRKAIEAACMRKIVEANRIMIENGGHLLQ